jgi:hypothetical protein
MMLERLASWWCRRFHHRIINWRRGSYECAICGRVTVYQTVTVYETRR